MGSLSVQMFMFLCLCLNRLLDLWLMTKAVVLMAASRRTATIVDPTNNLPLECMIRRVFTNSKGNDCMLLCPVDTPVQILKSTNIEGWSAVSDEEVESLLPTAAYALAKYICIWYIVGFVILLVEDFATQRRAYLNSDQCFRTSSRHVFRYRYTITTVFAQWIQNTHALVPSAIAPASGQCDDLVAVGGKGKVALLPIPLGTAGVLYAHSSRLIPDKENLGFRFPFDGPGSGGTCQVSAWDHINKYEGSLLPQLSFHDDGQDVDGVPTEGVEITCFHLDENGQLRIADDDLLDDPAVVGAIDEETEFNALVEEEAALLESVFGER
ncbi:hypothetical protein RDABS01_001751 [Bienertia sinuspersici]